MKLIFHLSLALVACAFSALTCLAQERERDAQPDRWHGLVLEVTTPEDAVRLLGNPSSDKMSDLRVFIIDKWVTEKQKQKIYRTLTFKKLQGIEEAQLSFLDNKLVMIRLEAKGVEKASDPNWIDPDDLPDMFGTKFTPWAVKFRRQIPPVEEFKQFAGDPPKAYNESLYHMVAISERSFLLARVDDSEAISVGLFTRGDRAGAREKNKEREKKNLSGNFPGKILFIQIISRSLEK